MNSARHMQRADSKLASLVSGISIFYPGDKLFWLILPLPSCSYSRILVWPS